MAAQVEPVAVELDRLGDSADRSVGLEDRSGLTPKGKDVRRGQAGRTSTEDRRVDCLALFMGQALVRFRAEMRVATTLRCVGRRQVSPPSLPDP
jgi:hypothetical protein